MRARRRTTPSAVLADFASQAVAGNELCRKPRQLAPWTHVVTLATYLGHDVVARRIDAGAGLADRQSCRDEVTDMLEDLECEPGRPTPQQVLAVAADSDRYEQITNRPHDSGSTIRFHVRVPMEGFEARTKTEPIASAIRVALISPGQEPVQL
jgi:hypothetical protein